MFEAEIKTGNLKKVLEVVSGAIQTQDGRFPVDKTLRPLVRGIANPLKLGEMGLDATHFVVSHHWKDHFNKKAAESGTPIEVRQLRQWIDEPKPMGLPTEAQNLVILMYAAQTDHSFFIHNAPDPGAATLSTIRDLCVLRKEKLPPPDQWATALERSGSIFGVAVSPLLNASNLSSLVTSVKKRASDGRSACQTYCQKLRDRVVNLGLPLADCDRLNTANATLRLLEKLHLTVDDAVVGALASAEIVTSAAAMAECLNKAGTLAGTLDGTNWEIFEAIEKLTDERKAGADAIRSAVKEVLRCDEHAKALAGALREAQSKAVGLLTKAEPPPPPPPGRTVVEQGKKEFDDIASAREKLEQLAESMSERRQIHVSITWRIDEEPAGK